MILTYLADFETDGRQFLAESEAGELESEFCLPTELAFDGPEMLTHPSDGAKPKRVDSGIAPADAEATVSVVTTYTLWNVTRTKTFEIAAQPKALHQRAYSMVSSTVVWSVDGGVPERMPVHPPSWDREEEKAGDTVLCGLTAGERRRTVGP